MLKATQHTGFGGKRSTGRPYWHQILEDEGLLGNTVFALDFASQDCYPGSGQTISDLSGNGNDFWMGFGSGSEIYDPTFVDAGLYSYMEFDGDDVMKMKALAAALNGLHKNNATWTFLCMFYALAGGSDREIFHTSAGAGDHGAQTGIGSDEDPELKVHNATFAAALNLNASSAVRFNTGAWNFHAVALDEAGGASASHFRTNGNTETFNGAYASPSATNSTGAQLGNPFGDPLLNGERVAFAAALDTDISTTVSGNLYSAVQAARPTFGV